MALNQRDDSRLQRTCAGHSVATCPDCRSDFERDELSYHTPQMIEAGDEIIEWPDTGWTRCPQCGRDLAEEIEAHSEMCPDYQDEEDRR
jgi:hypothetical protein